MNSNLTDCLFLFDIDGTILSTEGDGKKAFIKACETVLESPINHNIDFRGGIDRLVLEDVCLSALGEEFELQYIMSKFKSHYLHFLRGLSQKKENDWLMFKNADRIIKNLNSSSNVALVTGNIREGAMIKLNHFNLYDFFPTGGFGDEASSRTDLVFRALNEAEKYYNRTFDKKNIFLIGDTQKDVDSALENSIIPLFIDHYGKYEEYKTNNSVYYYTDFSTLLDSITDNSLFQTL